MRTFKTVDRKIGWINNSLEVIGVRLRLSLDRSNGGYRVRNLSGNRDLSPRGNLHDTLEWLNGFDEAVCLINQERHGVSP